MAVSLKHSTLSTATDSGDGKLSKNAWNEEHTLTGTADQLLGFDGAGAATEIDPATLTSGGVTDGDKGDVTVASGTWSLNADAPNIVNKAQHAADRTALAGASTAIPVAYLREAGREGVFVWDASDLSTEVTADTAQAIYVAPSSDTTGASGAWVRKFNGAANVKWFGAVGDGTTDDTAALLAAANYGASTGRALFVPKGTFLTNAASMELSGALADRFVIFGEGPSSIIKIKDGEIDADFTRMFRFAPTADMEVIEFRDLFLDHNARGSADPADPPTSDEWAYQHAHTIFVAPSGCTIKQVRFQNVIIKDPAADGFSISGATGTVTSFVNVNCAVIDRTRRRSDITFTVMPTTALITGFYGDVIEIEANAATANPTRLHIANTHVNRLDLAEDSAGSSSPLELCPRSH